jgi:HAD superfamily hydrolase (TIGR01459 family)
MPTDIPLLAGVSSLAPDYDGFVLDVWGVVHDGIALYPDVVDTLRHLDQAGKSVVMLSNAPRRSGAVIESMVAMGMPEELCRHVVSSGEATWMELRTRTDPWYRGLGARFLHIGPSRDENLFEGLDLEQVDAVEDADLIVNTGPWQDEETVDDYEAMLVAGARAGVAMLCANPDLEVIRGGQRIICAGALAARFEELGGKVRYLGKPRPSIYAYCFAHLDNVDRTRVLAVGDSLRTDIAGAEAAGIDAVFVLGGIHGDELGLGAGVAPDQTRVAEMCARASLNPVAAIPTFVW